VNDGMAGWRRKTLGRLNIDARNHLDQFAHSHGRPSCLADGPPTYIGHITYTAPRNHSTIIHTTHNRPANAPNRPTAAGPPN